MKKFFIIVTTALILGLGTFTSFQEVSAAMKDDGPERAVTPCACGGGGYSWELTGTTQGSSVLMDDAEEIAQQIAAGSPTIWRAVAGVISVAIFNTYNESPDHTYWTTYEYLDQDYAAWYTKTVIYIYDDAARTELIDVHTEYHSMLK